MSVLEGAKKATKEAIAAFRVAVREGEDISSIRSAQRVAQESFQGYRDGLRVASLAEVEGIDKWREEKRLYLVAVGECVSLNKAFTAMIKVVLDEVDGKIE